MYVFQSRSNSKRSLNILSDILSFNKGSNNGKSLSIIAKFSKKFNLNVLIDRFS